MVDWKSKLTSRKFWVCVADFVTGLLLYLKVDADKVDRIGGLIIMGAGVVAYIIGEGLIDAKRQDNAQPEGSDNNAGRDD